MSKSSTFTGRRCYARVAAACAAGVALATPAAAQNWPDDGGAGVNVSEYGTVDLAVQDTDLAQVLEMLSIQGRKNIITSKSVSATVSANLYDVTFYEALEAILSVNGYGYIEEGNFIYIYTQEELAEVEAANRRTESEIFVLEYLSATDANEFIAPLLSDVGRASARGDVQQGFQPDVSDGGADSYAYEAKIVVNDYQENLEQIRLLLDDLDTPPQQVLIEASILQTTLDEDNSWGVDFSAIIDMDYTDLGNPLAPVNNLLAGSDATLDGFQPPNNRAGGLQGTVGNTAGPGGFKVGYMNGDFAVFLKLLDEVTDTTVLARPKVMCLNRQRAEVQVGRRFGFLSTTTNQTTVTQTVQFLDTGIRLTFRPFISKNGMIRLELMPSVSEAVLRDVTDLNNNQVTVPDELTNELTTNVRVRDGETLVLGGLFRESTSITQRQVPWLGDIPLIGAAFTGQDDVVDRSEIIFLITPSVVHDEVLWEMGNEAQHLIDAVRVGGRDGLLPWSREKVTANYNERAMRAFRQGNLRKALHWCNTSLGVTQAQPAMIRLREELKGYAPRSFDAGLLERALRRYLGSLPKDQAARPREVALFGGGAGDTEDWFDTDTGVMQFRDEGGADHADPFGWMENDDDARDLDDGGDEDDDDRDRDTHRDGPSASVTDQMPRQLHPQRGFWQAGSNPGGFDDPAWKQPFPFITFDDVMEVAGNAEDGGSL